MRDAKLHVPIVTLSTKDNVNLTKQLSDGSIPAKVQNQGTNIYKLLSASFQSVTRLFVFAYVIAADAKNNEAVIKTIKTIFFQEERLKIITY